MAKETLEGSSRRFRKLAAAEQPEALRLLRAAIKEGGSCRGAALVLGIGEATMYRLGKAWPKAREILEAGMPTQQEIGMMGAVARAKRNRKRAKQ